MKSKLLGKNKQVISLLTVLLLITAMLFSGCGIIGVKLGFGYRFAPTRFICAAKSTKSIFNIDNVKLNFYYGSFNNDGTQEWDRVNENYEPVYVVVYFCNEKYASSIGTGQLLDDYRKIDGFYLVKKINIKEFTSGAYNITQIFVFDARFTHREVLTVPKDIFEQKIGGFYFFMIEICYSKKDACYWAGYSYGTLLLNYEKTGENSVRIY